MCLNNCFGNSFIKDASYITCAFYMFIYSAYGLSLGWILDNDLPHHERYDSKVCFLDEFIVHHTMRLPRPNVAQFIKHSKIDISFSIFAIIAAIILSCGIKRNLTVFGYLFILYVCLCLGHLIKVIIISSEFYLTIRCGPWGRAFDVFVLILVPVELAFLLIACSVPAAGGGSDSD